MAGAGQQGSVSDLMGDVLNEEVASGDAPDAVDDPDYAMRLQLLEYRELEMSLPEDLRPDESDLEARLALLRDIAQQQYFMQQQVGVQNLLGGSGEDEDLELARMLQREDDARVQDEEGTQETGSEGGDDESIDAAVQRLMEMARAAQADGMTGLQLFEFIQERIAPLGATLVPTVDVDNMSYEDLQDLCESIGNVKVGLTPEQIKARTTTVTFSAQSPDPAIQDDKCTVCQCEYEDNDQLRRLSCGHHFHAECIDTWLESSKYCPVCKAEVVEVKTPKKATKERKDGSSKKVRSDKKKSTSASSTSSPQPGSAAKVPRKRSRRQRTAAAPTATSSSAPSANLLIR